MQVALAASAAQSSSSIDSRGAATGVAGPVACWEVPAAAPAAGMAYSATRTEATVQTLGDGSKVTSVVVSSVARDGRGATFEAAHFLPGPGQEERSPKVMIMRLTDPAAETVSTWTTGQGSKTVTVLHIRGMLGGTPRAGDDVSVPVLGAKTIGGVYVLGYRITGRTPAGQQGNDRPLVNTLEWWCSPELRLTVLSVNDSLLTGRRTVELTDIKQMEPDAALFRLPEGYRVKDITPGED